MSPAWCRACRAEEDSLSVSEAFVLGMMVADLQHSGRIRMHATLCDRHGKFPHNTVERPRVPVRTALPKKPASCVG